MRRALVLAIVIGLALLGALMLMDRLIGRSVERVAESALGVPTEVGAVDLRPLAGQLTLERVQVANPAGFSTPYFVRLDRVSIEASLAALRQEPVRVARVVLSGVSVQLERGSGGTNYGAILEHASGPDDAADGSGPRWVIETLVMEEVRVELQLAGTARPLPVEIAPITLRDVGSREGGISRAQVVELITRTLLLNIAKQGDVLPRAILSELESRLRSGARARATRDALDRIGEGANELLRGLGELLPGRR